MDMAELSEGLAEVENFNEYRLANLADAGAPHPFLSHIRDEIVERLEYMTEEWASIEDPHDMIHEIVDSNIPVYTADLWEAFWVLSAWTEDVTEFGELTDMVQGAQTALYLMGTRFAYRILEEIGVDV